MNGGAGAAASAPPIIISDNIRQQIYTDYVGFLIEACRVFRLPLSCVEYSQQELALAIDEAEIDVQAMQARRSRTHGISPGKIAGVLAFRLSRFKIVHFKEAAWANSHFHLVQELAATLLVRKLFMPCQVPAKNILELSYQLSRRHANQETAGLFFDAFAAEAG